MTCVTAPAAWRYWQQSACCLAIDLGQCHQVARLIRIRMPATHDSASKYRASVVSHAPMSEPRTSRIIRPGLREAVVPHVAALSPLSSSGSKSDDRRDDRPAASSPEPADMSRRLWPHPGPVRSTRAAILTTDRLAATTAAATAAQRREPRSRDFASSLLPFNEFSREAASERNRYRGKV